MAQDPHARRFEVIGFEPMIVWQRVTCRLVEGAGDRGLGGPGWQAGEGQREKKKGGEVLKASTWPWGYVRSIRHCLHCAVIVGTDRPSVMR